MESLAVAQGEPSSTVGNVTAIATGANSAGIQSRYNDFVAGSHILNLTNSIAQGASDLRTEDGNGTGRIAVSNSNFDVIKRRPPAPSVGRAIRPAPPLFVNAAAGDYREAPGSPTIDAGSPTGIGPLDLAGNPRTLGPAPDIGAFEFVPAPAPEAALTSLTVSPKAFRPRKGGGRSSARRRAKRWEPTVRYALTAAATVDFTVERALKGRRVGGKCRQADDGQPEREEMRALPGAQERLRPPGCRLARTDSGSRAGSAPRPLKPGKYRLVATAGASVKRAAFTITR